ncbi:peptidoglycan-binding protein [Microvirga sp. 2YAF29]|uniref:peptidoglycan-binding domain-containing protein n=1 Tax=Microvirga sp. 2YAF29 TaxID=3233031 RepID=UPI003F99DC17
MRDAFAAESDDDFDLPAVVRRKAPPRTQKRAARQPKKVGVAERVIGQALSNPGKVLAALFLTGCSGAIAWNALALQNVRHPAPLFNHADPAQSPVAATPEMLPPARPGMETADAQTMLSPEPMHQAAASLETTPAQPVSAPRPPARSAMTDLIRNGGVPPAAAPQPATRPQQNAAVAAPAPARAATARDPIADMIRLGGPVPTPPANVGRQDPGDIVLAGQRALARLGYSVKVDGMMGPGTRQAIERFEQDRKLPVTGEFSGRTMRELSAQSGIAVQ